MPETEDGIELYGISFAYIPVIKFHVKIRHRKRLMTVTTNKKEQL